MRLRRSELSTPATNIKMIRTAAQSDADLVFLDLEDSVPPAAKAEARANVSSSLMQLDWGSKTRGYRINGVDTPWCLDDLMEVVPAAGHHLDIVIVPKVKATRDVWFIDDILTQLERKHGLEPGGIGIEILIEETEALANVETIAGCSERIEALILGFGDLAASQGIRAAHIGAANDGRKTAYPGDVWHYARNRLIVAARASGVDPIDGPFGNFNNPAEYAREASWASTLGAVGKWCIHPSQIGIANNVFAPTADEISEARSILRAVEHAGRGAASYDGLMIDAATTRIFESVVERARLCGLDDELSEQTISN
jgi:citrate lyase subunit beta / citryl-CoA lyase